MCSPLVLVKPDQGRIVFGEHLPEAMRGDEFVIGKMSHDQAWTPFAGSEDKVLLFAKDAGENYGHQFGTAAVTFQESRDVGHTF
jgi:hypothetical protein